MKWTMNPKKQWPTILNGQPGDSQDLCWCSERVWNTSCRLSTGSWWWSPRLASCSTSPRMPPSTLVTAWRTCWSTGTASTTSSTSKTTPRCRLSCCEGRSWPAQRSWVPASLRIGSFFVGWMCPETPAGKCGLGTKRCEERMISWNTVFLQVILVEGHFYGILPNVSRSEPVFVAWCTPVAMPETRECVVQVRPFSSSSSVLFTFVSCFLLSSSFFPICTLSLLSYMWFCRARLIYSRRSTPWT